MWFAGVIYIYLLTAASTFLVGVISIALSLVKENSTESTAQYIAFETQAPFAVQIVVSGVSVLEKILSAWNSSARYAVVSWGIRGGVYLCLCVHAAYTHDFRPFLGTWIAFLLNAHLFLQLSSKSSTVALPVLDKVPLFETMNLSVQNVADTSCDLCRKK